MTAERRRILIAGGGIGGLAAAIMLDRFDFAPVVLERSTFADESGAGIQLGPNATRALAELGLLDTVRRHAFRPDAISIFDAPTGENLTAIPLGDHAEQRYHAPYLTLHRADLHAALLEACKALGATELRSGFEVAAVEQDEKGVAAFDAERAHVDGAILIGADGLWSTIRKQIAPAATPRFTGATAWRAVLPRDRLPPPFDAPIVGLWLGPRAHLVHYPVRGGSELNVVAVTENGEVGGGWNEPGNASILRARLGDWSAPPRALLEAAETWRCWSLHRLPPLPCWTSGRIALLGDAAHPVLPYLAQGAALALEDAVDLARHLRRLEGDPALAFTHYETRRRRAERIRCASEIQGRRYHMDGLRRLARNFVLRHRRPEKLLARLDWLYRDRHAKPGL